MFRPISSLPRGLASNELVHRFVAVALAIFCLWFANVSPKSFLWGGAFILTGTLIRGWAYDSASRSLQWPLHTSRFVQRPYSLSSGFAWFGLCLMTAQFWLSLMLLSLGLCGAILSKYSEAPRRLGQNKMSLLPQLIPEPLLNLNETALLPTDLRWFCGFWAGIASYCAYAVWGSVAHINAVIILALATAVAVLLACYKIVQAYRSR